jgi:hypothetical protein
MAHAVLTISVVIVRAARALAAVDLLEVAPILGRK